MARFHEQGYLPAIPVLSAEEVQYYKSCLERLEKKFPNDTKKLKSKSHLLCPWVESIARHRSILDLHEALIGPNILCYSMAFRIKDADGKTHAGWHQDGAHNPIKPILVIGALALSACSLAHGCLRLLPGSHKTGVLDHVDSGDPTSILSRGQFISDELDASKAVNLELRPGEIALSNAGIVHSSPASFGAERRVVLLLETMPTEVEPRAHRDSAMLVRGVDTFGRVDIDPAPEFGFGEAELKAWRWATSRRGKNIFNGSPLAPTEVYGGGTASTSSSLP